MKSRSRHGLQAALLGLSTALSFQPVAAAFTWPGCTDVQEGEFKYQSLIGRGPVTSPKVQDAGLTEPIHLAFDLRPDNSTDIYWVERRGAIKRYIAATNQVVKVGEVGVFTGSEQGLSGIALDPGFRANRWLYLYYAPSAEGNVFRISRFTLSTDLQSLESGSEKVLIRIPSQRSNCCHTGGAMAFDRHGDLWIAVGKNVSDYPRSANEGDRNTSAEASSANPADMRGGLLRIRPDNSAKGYAIPTGNFGEYWSAWFKSQGNAALAAEYADPAKVLPEIYVKGTRNAYSIAVDPVRRWVAWGEFGVNLNGTMTEEHNLVTHPVFGGYPYFAGGGGTGGSGCTYYQGMCELWRGFSISAGTKDRNAPVNNSKWNAGPKQLPPVEPALHTYPRSGAVTGPIYRYAGESPSTIKFPPHFDKAWFVGDWAHNQIKVYKVSDDGRRLTDSLTWFAKFAMHNLLDIQQGPDGALYVVNYEGWFGATTRTHIARIEYTGNCRPAEPTFPKATDVTGSSGPEPGGFQVKLEAGSLRVEGPGPHSMRIRDARGREIRMVRGQGPQEYSLRALRTGDAGLGFITVEGGAQGARTVKWIDLRE